MKLFLFNLKLLLNKITIILLSSTIVLIALFNLLSLINLDNSESITVNSYLYLNNSIFYTKLISSFVSIYLFSYIITPKGDYSLYILRMFNYERRKVFFCKILVVSICILILIICSLFLFSIMGNIYFKSFMKLDYIVIYLNIYLLSIGYGIISLVLMQILNNNFVIILTCVINLLISGIEDIDGIIKLVVFVLPKLNEDGYGIYGLVHLIWIDIIYLGIGYLIYERRDLNY